jgi:hydrogenase maturation protease
MSAVASAPASVGTSPSGAPPRVVVFACGDALRGDDSAALLAVRGLPPEIVALADVRVVGALHPEMLVGLPDGTRAIIVDAVTGLRCGEFLAMDLDELGDRSGRVVTTSSHQLSLDRVVALAQLLRDQPLEGRFIGIGIEAVTLGEGPGHAVTEAIPAFGEAIAQAIGVQAREAIATRCQISTT